MRELSSLPEQRTWHRGGHARGRIPALRLGDWLGGLLGASLLGAGLLAGCAPAPGRDWAAYPAVVQREAGPSIYAVSDVHGGYDRLVALLLRHGLIAAAPGAPDAVRWTGGPATLLLLGDLVDKGPDGPAVLDLAMALATGAEAAGGAVLVTLGNHEAEFLVNPANDKAVAADGFATQLRAQGLSPEALARGTDARGRWLRQRPFAVRIGDWFFAHAGDTHGRDIAELERVLRDGVDRRDYDAPEIVGGTSLLEAEDWADSDPGIGARYARAVGAAHIVFGHNPSDLGQKGAIGQAQGGALFRIDCGMSPGVDYGPGAIFSVQSQAGRDLALSLEADGRIRELWRAP